jgi:hypothetical protein
VAADGYLSGVIGVALDTQLGPLGLNVTQSSTSDGLN